MRKEYSDDSAEPVFNLDDLLEARDERTSTFAEDIDGLPDLDQTEVDVDDALTFPHPHRRNQPASDTEGFDTTNKDDIGFDYQDSVEEMLPSDYSEPYSDAISTELEDAEVVAEQELHDVGAMTPEDVSYRSAVIEPPGEQRLEDIEDNAA